MEEAATGHHWEEPCGPNGQADRNDQMYANKEAFEALWVPESIWDL